MVVDFPDIDQGKLFMQLLSIKVIISPRKQKTENTALILHQYVQLTTFFFIFI
jgi:hypothetical protein